MKHSGQGHVILCPHCGSDNNRKHGLYDGYPRRYCKNCKRTWCITARFHTTKQISKICLQCGEVFFRKDFPHKFSRKKYCTFQCAMAKNRPIITAKRRSLLSRKRQAFLNKQRRIEGKPGLPLLPEGRWSFKYECCQNCWTKERPHNARGFCDACYEVKKRQQAFVEFYGAFSSHVDSIDSTGVVA